MRLATLIRRSVPIVQDECLFAADSVTESGRSPKCPLSGLQKEPSFKSNLSDRIDETNCETDDRHDGRLALTQATADGTQIHFIQKPMAPIHHSGGNSGRHIARDTASRNTDSSGWPFTSSRFHVLSISRSGSSADSQCHLEWPVRSSGRPVS